MITRASATSIDWSESGARGPSRSASFSCFLTRLPIVQPSPLRSQPDHRLDQLDLVERPRPSTRSRRCCSRLPGLGRDDALARDVDRDVADLHAEQQVAADPADRQLAVQVLLRLADDVAPQPVAEPRRLRHDERQRHDADHQGADERDDLQQTDGGSHRSLRRVANVARGTWHVGTSHKARSHGTRTEARWHVARGTSERLPDAEMEAERTFLFSRSPAAPESGSADSRYRRESGRSACCSAALARRRSAGRSG